MTEPDEEWVKELELILGLSAPGSLKWERQKELESFIENLLASERRTVAEKIQKRIGKLYDECANIIWELGHLDESTNGQDP